MKILIVGLGSIAHRHVEALRLLDQQAELYALRNNRECSIEAGVNNLYDLGEAKEISFDFAIISNPSSMHIETIDKLLFLKCPLFIEKPLSDVMNAGEIIRKIKDLGILTYVACNLRFLDALVFVKDFLKTAYKRINEVNIYCGSFLPDWRPGVDFRNCYSAREDMGGGVHLDLIHEIDYAYWLFGRPQHVCKTFKSSSSLNISAVDYANYCLEYERFCASIVLNYYRRDYKRTLEIVFDDCTWLVDLERNCVTQGDHVIFQSEKRVRDTYLKQMQYFVNLVKTDQSGSFNSIDMAYDILDIALGYED